MDSTYTVAELSSAIGRAVARAFADEIWVEGEIRDLSRSRNGHVYFTLVDPESEGDAGQPAAVLPVTLFASDRGVVNRVLVRSGAMRMTDGVHVRIRGRVTHYAGRGTVQLRMSFIDTDYTIGKLAAGRLALVRRLDAEGLLEANARVALAGLPLRLALVTSSGSAAHADFLAELSQSGYAFEVTVIDARTQGPGAAAELALGLASAEAVGCDVVAVVRGGGAQTDMAAFDDERVARAIAGAALPVFTGIGHEVDTTVADMVAARSFKTPTACASALVGMVRAFEERLGALESSVAAAGTDAALRAETGLAARGARLATAARLHVWRHDRELADTATAVRRRAPHAVARAAARAMRIGVRTAAAARHGVAQDDGRLADAAHRLRVGSRRALAGEERALDGLASLVRAHQPERMLARGWTLTYAGERLVRRPGDVTAGDRLRTRTAYGDIGSVVENGDDGADE